MMTGDGSAMKIAYLTSVYGRASDSFVRQEVRLLRERGHQLHTFSVRKPPASDAVDDQLKQEQAGTDYILDAGGPKLLAAAAQEMVANPGRFVNALKLSLKARAPGLKGTALSLAYLVEAAYLARGLRGQGIDHLHNHIAENSASVAMLASELTGIPYSMTVHGPSEWDRPMDLALDEKVRRSSFVAVISNFTRGQLMRWCSADVWSRLHVVRCGLDRDFLEAPAVPLPAENRMVFVGRLVDAKGPQLLVDALARLAGEGARFSLDIIGDGPLRPAMTEAIEKAGFAGSVRFLGWQSAEEVRRVILASRFMVLPSLAEGLPVVLMEALALRRPVITTYTAGIPELIKPGVNGWLVPAGSVDDLAAALRDAFSRPTADLERMGAAGGELVRQLHDAATEVDKLERLMRNDPAPAPAAVPKEAA
jgi:colanic acid/amylovoran biosynthesis glycosyltransferase